MKRLIPGVFAAAAFFVCGAETPAPVKPFAAEAARIFRFGKDACGIRPKRLDRFRRLRSPDKKFGCRENAGKQTFHWQDSY